jgi:hypothetical protein
MMIRKTMMMLAGCTMLVGIPVTAQMSPAPAPGEVPQPDPAPDSPMPAEEPAAANGTKARCDASAFDNGPAFDDGTNSGIAACRAAIRCTANGPDGRTAGTCATGRISGLQCYGAGSVYSKECRSFRFESTTSPRLKLGACLTATFEPLLFGKMIENRRMERCREREPIDVSVLPHGLRLKRAETRNSEPHAGADFE